MNHVSITKTRLKDGSTRYRLRQEIAPDPLTGKRQWHSETVRTLDEANARRRALLLDPVSRARRMTLADYLREDWLPAYRHQVTASSYRTRRTAVGRWLVPYLGTIALGDLTTHAIEQALPRMGRDGCTVARQHAVVATLSIALNAAVRNGSLAHNPCQHVRLPRREAAVERIVWTAQQARWFLSTQEGVWRALWATLMGTGLRIAEARALRWRDLDLAAHVIAVRHTWARGDAGVYLSQPKSKAGRRTLVIPAALVAILQDWQREQRRDAWANGLTVGEETWVFARGDLSPLPEQTTYTRWRAEVVKSGLPYCTLHGLRHLAVTEQLNAGVPLKVVSVRIGHSNIGLTANLYGHVLREHQEGAAQALEGLITGQRDAPVTSLAEKRQKHTQS